MTQWNIEPVARPQHSEHDIRDIQTQTPKKQAKYRSARAAKAIKNVMANPNVRDNCQAVNLGLLVASAADIDAALRVEHHRRYRETFGLGKDEFPFVEDVTNLAAASLIGFHRRRIAAGQIDSSRLAIPGSKGISAELGHVDQLGDWGGTKLLDEEIRALPSSEEIADEDLEFSRIYGSDDPRIHYRMRLIEAHNGELAGVSFSRNRAVADIVTSEGSKYEIIKRSSFVVAHDAIDDNAALGLNQLGLKLLDGKDKDPRFVPKFAYEVDLWAKEVIEPFITDKSKRERSHAVLAASCTYFALLRCPAIAESESE